MPMSHAQITQRREADQAVSRAFGRAGAAVHSPNRDRPDNAVTEMVRAFEAAGFALATAGSTRLPALIEVFPLAALVRLLNVERRPAYKVGKISRYGWQGDRAQRIDHLLDQWRFICNALQTEVGELGIGFPPRSSVRTASSLKPFEDALDAVISAWVGACFLEGTAEAFPAHAATAAIWIPKTRGNDIKP
jgi:predicted RNase H-like nuclease